MMSRAVAIAAACAAPAPPSAAPASAATCAVEGTGQTRLGQPQDQWAEKKRFGENNFYSKTEMTILFSRFCS